MRAMLVSAFLLMAGPAVADSPPPLTATQKALLPHCQSKAYRELCTPSMLLQIAVPEVPARTGHDMTPYQEALLRLMIWAPDENVIEAASKELSDDGAVHGHTDLIPAIVDGFWAARPQLAARFRARQLDKLQAPTNQLPDTAPAAGSDQTRDLAATSKPPAGDINHPSEKSTEVAVERDRGGTFEVPVLINGVITRKFAIDSGSADVALTPDDVAILKNAGTITAKDDLGTRTYRLADGKAVQCRSIRIHSLKVGDSILENVTGHIAPEGGTSLLGLSFLSNFKSWSIDNRRQVLVLQSKVGGDGTIPNGQNAAETPAPGLKPIKLGIAFSAAVTGDKFRALIAIYLSNAVTYKVFPLSNPYRIVVDFPAIEFRLPRGRYTQQTELVTGFRYGLFGPGRSRLVIDTAGPVIVESAGFLSTEGQSTVQFRIALAAADADELSFRERRRRVGLPGVASFPQPPHLGGPWTSSARGS